VDEIVGYTREDILVHHSICLPYMIVNMYSRKNGIDICIGVQYNMCT